MAELKLTFPDDKKARIMKALGDKFGYRSTIIDPTDNTKTIDNPENRGAFVKRIMADLIKEMVIDQEASSAANDARNSKAEQGKTEIDIS